jgi:hypothetical protein
VAGYRLHKQDSVIDRARELFNRHRVQICSETHSVFHSMGAVGFLKRPKCETGHSPPSSPVVKNPCSLLPSFNTSSWSGA